MVPSVSIGTLVDLHCVRTGVYAVCASKTVGRRRGVDGRAHMGYNIISEVVAIFILVVLKRRHVDQALDKPVAII